MIAEKGEPELHALAIKETKSCDPSFVCLTYTATVQCVSQIVENVMKNDLVKMFCAISSTNISFPYQY